MKTNIYKILMITTLLFLITFSLFQIYFLRENDNRIGHFFEYQNNQYEEETVASPDDDRHEKRYNFFFVESDKSRLNFDLKELCAVESAALNNPNANVYVYYLKAKIGIFIYYNYLYNNNNYYYYYYYY
jgi:hypothetical protein